MIKENKKAIIIALIVMLIPVLAGLALWNRLPEEIVTHWDLEGNPNGWSGRGFTIFGLNGILIGAFMLCVFGTATDPKRSNITPKNFKIVIGIVPVVSLFANALTYAAALGYKPDVPRLSKLLVAVVFVVIGNYIPKMRQSYTVGIKLPWTLSSEDNWNRTHRFAGKLWLVIGLVLLADAILGFLKGWMYPVLLGVMVLVPVAFSYLYYRKHEQD